MKQMLLIIMVVLGLMAGTVLAQMGGGMMGGSGRMGGGDMGEQQMEQESMSGQKMGQGEMLTGREMTGSMMQMMHQMADIMKRMSGVMSKDIDNKYRKEMTEMMGELSKEMEAMFMYMKAGKAPRAELMEKKKHLNEFRKRLQRYKEIY